MITTGIRLETPQNLYEKLQTEQKKCRIKTVKKPALSAIILDFCSEKLEENERTHSDVHSVHESVRFSESPDTDNIKIDSEIEKRFRNREEQLSIKNKSLQERERKVAEQEKEIFKQKMEILDMKSKVLDEREKNQKKALEGAETVIEMRLLQNELSRKNEKIQRLEKE